MNTIPPFCRGAYENYSQEINSHTRAMNLSQIIFNIFVKVRMKMRGHFKF